MHPTTDVSGRDPERVGWPTWLALVVVPALVFLNTLPNTFHLDDHFRVLGNPGVEQLLPLHRHFLDPSTSTSLPLIEQYRPMLPLTLSISYALSGHSTAGYHLGNLAVHIASVLLVFGLLRELLRRAALPPDARPATALAAALLFAVHPVSGVPINYICSRDLALMQVFLLGAFFVYVRMRRLGDTPGRWTATLLLATLSLLSKTNAVALPALVLAYELLLGDGPRRLSSWLRMLPFAAVVAGFFLWTELGLRFSDLDQIVVDEGHELRYPLTEASAHLTYYLRNALWPLRMRPLPAFPWVEGFGDPGAVAGLALIAGSLLLAAQWSVRRPVAAFTILAYWTLFAPTSSFLPFRSPVADYRAYPSLPYLCLAAVLAGRALLPARARAPALIVALVAYAGASIWINTLWRTEASLWEHSVRHGGTAVAKLNLANTIQADEPERAKALLAEAIDEIPDYIRAHLLLGLIQVRNGEPDDGIRRMEYAVGLAPGHAYAYRWLAIGLAEAGRWEEAVEPARRAMELAPHLPDYVELVITRVYEAAHAAQRDERHEDALRLVDELHALREPHRDSEFVAAWSLDRLGRLDEAVAAYDRHLAAHPDAYQATFNRAYALMALGRFDEAVDGFEAALDIKPDALEPHVHLASLLTTLGRPDEARRHGEIWEARPR